MYCKKQCEFYHETLMQLNIYINEKVTNKYKPHCSASAAVEIGAGWEVAVGADVATVPACAPSANWEIYSQETQRFTAAKLGKKDVKTNFTTSNIMKTRNKREAFHSGGGNKGKERWRLTVTALEVEDVKARDTAVMTLDKLFSNVTSATVLDKLKPLYVLQKGRKIIEPHPNFPDAQIWCNRRDTLGTSTL